MWADNVNIASTDSSNDNQCQSSRIRGIARGYDASQDFEDFLDHVEILGWGGEQQLSSGYDVVFGDEELLKGLVDGSSVS